MSVLNGTNNLLNAKPVNLFFYTMPSLKELFYLVKN